MHTDGMSNRRQRSADKRTADVGASDSINDVGEPSRRNPAEKSGSRKMESLEGNMTDTQESVTVSTKQERIAELARRNPEMSFVSLAHHMDMNWLREAYYLTRKDGAVGVDGQTAKDYGINLEENLRSLLERAKSGKYCAPPVRRVYIPKGNNEKRPIGIPAFEDKVLQRSVVMIMESIYEQDFLECSYGFRPGRSAHQAIKEIQKRLYTMGGGWVLEVDIRKYFDTIDQSKLREIIRQRIRDGVIVRLIGKWLKAGVMEAGQITHPKAGTPQGGVISPMLSNIYLHEVMDKWFEKEVKPRLKGKAFEVRFADDFILGFTNEEDVKRVMKVLPKRFEKYGLQLHPEKTRIIEFNHPDKSNKPDGRNNKGSGTFDFLGFTHYWGKTQKRAWMVKQKTAKSRLSRALKRITDWCRQWLHLPVSEQQQILRKKMFGHYSYYGIVGNSKSLGKFYWVVRRIWRKWLSRRSQKAKLNWDKYPRLLIRYPLPFPSERNKTQTA